MPDRPNILFILTDQQHFGMMSCAGNRYVHTPAMDRLAARGVRFDRAYCANPVCSPSRFSLFTGRFPSEIGMFSNHLRPGTVVPDEIKQHGLGHLMRQAGYDTLYGGKQHLPKMTAQDIGFEVLSKDEREQLADDCATVLKQERDKPFFLVASFINPHDICYMAIRDSATNDSELGLLKHGKTECATLDEALTRPKGVSDEEFFARHCPPLPANFEPQRDEPEMIRTMIEQRPFRKRAREQWSEERWREHRWAYARLTQRVDRQIGTVLDALAQGPHADNTWVVFTSDHGDMDAAHRLEHKSTYYDEAARIPLIVCPPGSQPPPGSSQSSAPVKSPRLDTANLVSNGLDLLPTFCDIAGVTPPTGLLGRSIKPLVDHPASAPWREYLPVETGVGRMIVTQRFKYIRCPGGESAEQLLDLVADPHEVRNAAHDREHHKQLDRHRKMFDDAFGTEAYSPDETHAILRGA